MSIFSDVQYQANNNTVRIAKFAKLGKHLDISVQDSPVFVPSK